MEYLKIAYNSINPYINYDGINTISQYIMHNPDKVLIFSGVGIVSSFFINQLVDTIKYISLGALFTSTGIIIYNKYNQ